MKARIRVTALILVVLLFGAMALGSGSSSSGSKNSDAAEKTDTASASATGAENENKNTDKTADSSAPVKDKGPEITFDELTVIDNEECMVRITGIDPDNLWGYTLKVNMENKSAEKTYMFSVKNASINGVQDDPFFAAEVAAGKKANKEINFSGSTLKENGLDTYTDIELTFRVYDSDDWQADDVAEETVHVYPYGAEKASVFVRAPQPGDTVVVDNDSVTVIVTGYANDSIWGYTANLYLVNKTETELMFSVDDASVNGYMADPFWAKSVIAGKSAFSSMSWSSSTFEENGIDEVEEIEMELRIYDSNNWFADDIYKEVVVLNP